MDHSLRRRAWTGNKRRHNRILESKWQLRIRAKGFVGLWENLGPVGAQGRTVILGPEGVRPMPQWLTGIFIVTASLLSRPSGKAFSSSISQGEHTRFDLPWSKRRYIELNRCRTQPCFSSRFVERVFAREKAAGFESWAPGGGVASHFAHNSIWDGLWSLCQGDWKMGAHTDHPRIIYFRLHEDRSSAGW
jgi:hypothetical protein